jgi:hypothetical protein
VVLVVGEIFFCIFIVRRIWRTLPSSSSSPLSTIITTIGNQMTKTTKSFIGVLYSKVIPGSPPGDNVITAREYYYDDAKNIHLKKEMSLYESDINLEEMKGMPLYVNHEYMYGPVGTIAKAWFSTDKTLGSKYYNHGLHHGQEQNQDGLRLVIKGKVEQDKLEFVYKQIDVNSLEDASLSVGYRYKCTPYKWNNAGTPIEYKITDKKIFEGSLCKYGRIANSGVVVLCSMDSQDPNNKSQTIQAYENSNVKLVIDIEKSIQRQLAAKNNDKKPKQEKNNRTTTIIINTNTNTNSTRHRQMESNNTKTTTTTTTTTVASNGAKEEASRNSADQKEDNVLLNGSTVGKQPREGVQLENYYSLFHKHAEQLGLNPNDPDVGAKLIVCMLEEREERIVQYSERTKKMADNVIDAIKTMSEEYPTYSLSTVECSHIKNLLSEPKNELVFRCFSMFFEKQKALEKQLNALQNARKETRVRSLQDLSIDSEEGRDANKKLAYSMETTPMELDGMESTAVNSRANNNAKSNGTTGGGRRSLFNLAKNYTVDGQKHGLIQNSLLSAGISDVNHMSVMIKQLSEDIQKGIQSSKNSRVRDSRFNNTEL